MANISSVLSNPSRLVLECENPTTCDGQNLAYLGISCNNRRDLLDCKWRHASSIPRSYVQWLASTSEHTRWKPVRKMTGMHSQLLRCIPGYYHGVSGGIRIHYLHGYQELEMCISVGIVCIVWLRMAWMHFCISHGNLQNLKLVNVQCDQECRLVALAHALKLYSFGMPWMPKHPSGFWIAFCGENGTWILAHLALSAAEVRTGWPIFRLLRLLQKQAQAGRWL